MLFRPRTFLIYFVLNTLSFKAKKNEKCPRTRPKTKKLDTKSVLKFYDPHGFCRHNDVGPILSLKQKFWVYFDFNKRLKIVADFFYYFWTNWTKTAQMVGMAFTEVSKNEIPLKLHRFSFYYRSFFFLFVLILRLCLLWFANR